MTGDAHLEHAVARSGRRRMGVKHVSTILTPRHADACQEEGGAIRARHLVCGTCRELPGD